MAFSIPYGRSYIHFDPGERNEVDLISPQKALPAPDPISCVENALNSQEAHQILVQFKNCRSVAIAINDKTRPVPHQYLLPPLLAQLESLGIERSNILLWIASGTHVPMEKTEFDSILPAEIVERYKVASHNADEPDNLVFLGTTSRGTPAWINKSYYAAELKIVVGDIEPHHFAGFSGGVKSAVIGLAGRSTINTNHAMLRDPNSFIGKYAENPLRQDIEELGRMAGIQFALNAVLNSDKEIIEALAGDPWSVMQRGIPLSTRYCQVLVDSRYDVVIASPGGYPKDINLYQSQKALTHASLLTKDKGTVILLAACTEGSGSKLYEEFMRGLTSIDDVILKFSQTEFKIGPHKAFQFAQILKRINVILVSEIEPALVGRLLLTPAGSLEEALTIGLKNASGKPRIACMPYAISTVPLIKD